MKMLKVSFRFKKTLHKNLNNKIRLLDKEKTKV